MNTDRGTIIFEPSKRWVLNTYRPTTTGVTIKTDCCGTQYHISIEEILTSGVIHAGVVCQKCGDWFVPQLRWWKQMRQVCVQP